MLARIGSHLAMAKIRRETEQALRDSEKRFRALVSATSYVVYRMSPDWTEMRLLEGRGFISDTGRPRTDWLEEYIHPNDRELVLRTIREAVRTKSGFQLEHQVRRTDGSVGWTYSRAVPLFDDKGEIIEWFGAASDITGRKDAEEKYRKLAETLDAKVRARTRDLEERNAEIVRQSEQVRELSWRLLRAQEEERRYIARELHDSAGQTLTVLGFNLAQLVEKAERHAPELATNAATIDEMVQQLHRDIRTTSYLLHPPLLDESGLYSALRWYTQGLVERSNLQINLEISQDFGRLPGDMELVVFRSVQECLTNIHRHSGSKTAWIRITREATQVTVEIRDQGNGMSPAKLAEIQSGRSGVGIRGMQERLRQFKSEMKIESDHAGTRILVIIPVPKSATAEDEPKTASLQPAT
jgi:signal transduction histidine kinase